MMDLKEKNLMQEIQLREFCSNSGEKHQGLEVVLEKKR